MNAELKAKWVEALRSGKYKQGTGTLRRSGADDADTFCCLGVLCDVESPGGWLENNGHGRIMRRAESSPNDAYIPEQIAESAGLREVDQEILVDLNDDHCKTFPEIASYIEDNL